MKRVSFLVALASFAAVGSLTIPAASQTTQSFTICLPSRSGFEKGVDVAAKGFSSGDYAVFQDPIVDAETGERIGRSYGRSTIIKLSKKDGSLLLETTFDLTGRGKIVTYDATRFSRLDKGRPEPVIGGTGNFASARGTASTVEGRCAGRKGALISFDLILE